MRSRPRLAVRGMARFDYQESLARETPAAILRPAGMLGPNDRRLLYILARSLGRDATAVVDAGSLIGASAYCLAEGLAGADTPPADGTLHCYDTFRITESYLLDLFPAPAPSRHGTGRHRHGLVIPGLVRGADRAVPPPDHRACRRYHEPPVRAPRRGAAVRRYLYQRSGECRGLHRLHSERACRRLHRLQGIPCGRGIRMCRWPCIFCARTCSGCRSPATPASLSR